MSNANDDHVQLVKKAQLGDRESLLHLAETARVRLYEYVFRVTLNEDLTQDIVQETVLEMLKIFKKLRRAEKFWPWLYAIAFNKVRNHYGKRWRQKTRCFSETGYEPQRRGGGDALAEAVTAEIKEVVLGSIRELEPRHRAVLTMRCYDQMSYAQIAELMDSSEVATRALFYRAKKALARRLSAHGLGRGSLLLALVAFGKMTATTEAAAAQVSVTAATLHVGPTAAVVAMLTSRVGLITAVTAGALITGSVTVDGDRIASIFGGRPAATSELPVALWKNGSSDVRQECWYYFPQGPGGPVMVRLVEFDPSGKSHLCRILQNQYANYHAGRRGDAVHISNHRAWKPDLSVRRLPTDRPALSEFISHVEGFPSDMELTDRGRKGLLVACKRQGAEESRIWRIDRHMNVLEEEYFHFSWPESTRTIERRDAMHQRGWTLFRIDGRLHGTRVSGRGRIPFVYATCGKHYPWLEIRVGKDRKLIDTPDGACIHDGDNPITIRYPDGSFFRGLGRPWMGLHCIDTVRRDAAEQRLWFETAYDGRTGRATVTVDAEPLRLVYTMDMETDLVERVTFLRGKAREGDVVGELRFEYLQDVEEVDDEFAPPRIGAGTPTSPEPGMLWLTRLVP